MTLLSPWWLLALLAAVPLVAIHMRRGRPPVHDVASLALWRELTRDARPARKRLTRPSMPLALVLQLAALALAALALARPASAPHRPPSARVYVLDASVWMRADGRMASATAALRHALATVPPGAPVRIVTAGPTPTIAFTGSAHAAAGALGALRAGYGQGDLDAALRLAAGLGGRVTLLRAPADPAPTVHAAAGAFTQIVVGGAAQDQGLTGALARCGLPAPSACEAFARVLNTGDSPQTDRVSALVGGRAIGAETVLVAPRSSSPVTFPVSAGMRVELRLTGAGAPAVAAHAFVAVPAAQPVSVTLVGQRARSLPLAGALAAVAGVSLKLLTPASYRASDAAGADLLVLDGWEPAGALPHAPALLLVAPPRLPGGRVAGALADARLSGADPTSALLAGVDLASLTIEREAARRLTPPAWMQAAAWSPEGPLLAAGSDGGQRVATLAFDPSASNLPQLASFPRLVADLVAWSQEWAPATATAGQPLLVQAPPGSGAATLEAGAHRLTAAAGVLTAPAPGFATVRQAGRSRTLAVNVEAAPATPSAQPVSLGARTAPGQPTRTSWWPWALAAALAMLAVELLHAVRSAGRHARAAIGLRLAAVALLAGALAQPRVGHGSGGPTVLAIDRSASIGPSARTAERAWLRAAREDDCASPCRAVQFAGVAQLTDPARGLLAGGTAGVLRGQETNLEGALRVALAQAPPGGQVALVSDGLQTAGEVASLAAEARARHVRVDVVPLADGWTDAAVTRLHAPAALHAGDPLSLEATVRSSRAATATLSLRVDGASAGSQRVSLAAGENPLLLSLRAGAAGWHTYTLEVVMPGDQAPANDALTTSVRVAAEPNVLIAGEGSSIVGALRADGIDARTLSPAQLPASAGGYGAVDAVVLDDVSAAQLGEARARALASGVRAGVGLLALGGPHSFSLGGYYRSALQPALPVASLEPGQLQQRHLAVELVLDRSGSMIEEAGGVPKLEMAQIASIEAAKLLAAGGDELGIVDFDIEPHTLLPLTKLAAGTTVEAIDRRIEGLVAEGGTNIYTALADAARQIEASGQPNRRIVLVTDGVSEPGSFGSLLTRLDREHIPVTTVALGDEADFSLLHSIAAATGGSYFATDNAAELPRIFATQTHVSARPVLVRGHIATSAGVSTPVVRSLAGAALPSLRGNVVTTLKPGATASVLASDPGHETDPALAQWQYGGGRVVAWTPGLGEFAGAWATRAQLWQDALRWVERGVGVPALTPAAAGGADELRIDTVENAGVAVEAPTIDGTLTAAGGRKVPLSFGERAPGEYTAALPELAGGAYRYALSDGTAAVEGTLAIPYASEQRPAPADQTPLGALASATGGRVLGAGDAAALASSWTALWPWLTVAALLCLLAAVAASVSGSDGGEDTPPRTPPAQANTRPRQLART